MQVNWTFTKSLAFSALTLLLTLTNAYAGPMSKKDPCERPEVCCEEPRPGTYGYNLPKDLGLACPSDFYFHADYLFMQPKMDGLEYAITNTQGNLSTQTDAGFPVAGGNVLGFSTDNHDWKWGSGLRVGIGFYLNHDAWTINFDWLWFEKSSEVSSSIVNSGNLIALWMTPAATTVPDLTNQTASARWHLSMNIADLSISKPYHVGPFLILNPFFGIRGAWFDQHYIARYGGLWNGQNGVKMIADNDFWGVGPRAGMNTEWMFHGGWELLANLAFSGLFSKFDVSQELALGSLSYQLDHKFFRSCVNMDLQVGVGWGTYFNQHKNHIALQLMYEFQQWWDQNWMRRFWDADTVTSNDTVSRGDLSLNGLSVKLLFDF